MLIFLGDQMGEKSATSSELLLLSWCSFISAHTPSHSPLLEFHERPIHLAFDQLNFAPIISKLNLKSIEMSKHVLSIGFAIRNDRIHLLQLEGCSRLDCDIKLAKQRECFWFQSLRL